VSTKHQFLNFENLKNKKENEQEFYIKVGKLLVGLWKIIVP
jgi:hypothetical protein